LSQKTRPKSSQDPSLVAASCCANA
jgi:hypothetical protein